MSERIDQILDVAEAMARTGGYRGFSFREIAKQVGIKSASIHYHFPDKEALGVALANRYTERFLIGLGDPESLADDPGAAIDRLVQAYRRSLTEDQLMCLCGLFGAEIGDLPPRVQDETKLFFQRTLAWLQNALGPTAPAVGPNREAQAYHILATLEGALILARSLNDLAAFDAAIAGLNRYS